jgi:lysosomal Pro-X carboxypeptidase
MKSSVFLFLCISSTIASRFFDPIKYASINDDYLFNEDAVMSTPVYSYKTAWTDVIFPVDHFSYTNADRFKLKYLYDDSTYKAGGPIFFYAGNEGSIEGFANNTGIIWDLAPQFNAMVVFAEHRYYGESQPYGNSTYSYSDISRLGFLSSAQALADYAMFLPWFKNTWKLAADTPVIVFGGSYGGMLATWFRLKYPTLTLGAWASSAPVTYFHLGGVDVGAFDSVVKNTFVSSGCNVTLLNRAFDVMTAWGQTEDGRQKLTNIFVVNELSPLNSSSDVAALKLYLQGGMEYMAMTDYPYPTSFLNTMPGWPVKTGCDNFMNTIGANTDDTSILYGLRSLTNVYFNTTGTTNTTCLNSTLCGGDVNGDLDSGNPDGWDFQECTEIIIEMCSLGQPNDFFDSDCNSTTFLDFQYNLCNNIYGKIGWAPKFLREDAVLQEYGWDFSKATNIIFTNGALDPWSAGGVNAGTPGIGANGDPSRGIYNFVVGGSAHHLDLRNPASCDPDSVISVRVQAVQIITCWLNPNSAGCPFQPYALPTFINMPANSNCTYLASGGYPWTQPPPAATPTLPQTPTTTASNMSSTVSVSSPPTQPPTTSSAITTFKVTVMSVILLIVSYIAI